PRLPRAFRLHLHRLRQRPERRGAARARPGPARRHARRRAQDRRRGAGPDHSASPAKMGALMITTHVLDTALGRPGAGVPVTLEVQDRHGWRHLGAGTTDADGRLRTLVPADAPHAAGTYRLRFDTASYFAGREGFFPWVEIVFVAAEGAHYHVPLLLSPYGYSTYRGS